MADLQKKDLDGFNLPNEVQELSSPERGCLEVLVQRGNSKVTRYFEAEGPALAGIYKQAITNPAVLMYEIV